MTKSGTDDTAELSFGAAMGELESILRRVESEEVDIDELADELKRAAQLLETCRAKIRRAEVEVSQIVQNLEGSDGPASDAESADDAAQTPDEPAAPGATGTPTLFETGD